VHVVVRPCFIIVELVVSPGPMILRAPGKLIVVGPLYYKKFYIMQRSILILRK
jgi:hypothetical protein